MIIFIFYIIFAALEQAKHNEELLMKKIEEFADSCNEQINRLEKNLEKLSEFSGNRISAVKCELTEEISVLKNTLLKTGHVINEGHTTLFMQSMPINANAKSNGTIVEESVGIRWKKYFMIMKLNLDHKNLFHIK